MSIESRIRLFAAIVIGNVLSAGAGWLARGDRYASRDESPEPKVEMVRAYATENGVTRELRVLSVRVGGEMVKTTYATAADPNPNVMKLHADVNGRPAVVSVEYPK